MSTSPLRNSCVALGRCWHSCFSIPPLSFFFFLRMHTPLATIFIIVAPSSPQKLSNANSLHLRAQTRWRCRFCICWISFFVFFADGNVYSQIRFEKNIRNILESCPEPLPEASWIIEVAGAVWGTTRSVAAAAVGDSVPGVPAARRAV